MAETDKLQIFTMDATIDHCHWRIRVKATISAKELSDAFSDIAVDDDQKTFTDHQQ